MNYKQNATFGTAMGGLCSLFANCFVWFYVILIMFAFITSENQYNETISQGYNSLTDPVYFTLKASSVIPAWQILSYSSERTLIDNTDLFIPEFFIADNGDTTEKDLIVIKDIEAITCAEYIATYLQDLEPQQI